MKLRSQARELAAIAVVGAALLGAQVIAHLSCPPGDVPDMWLGGVLEPGMAEAAVRAVLNERYELVKSGGKKHYLRVKDGLSLSMPGAMPSQRIEGAVWFHQRPGGPVALARTRLNG